MYVGYQGIEDSYSYQVCDKFLDMKKIDKGNLQGFKSFEEVFRSLLFGLINFAVLPIENSIGGCIFVNYDLFYKYDIKIHSEFQHNIEHSLYSTTKDISKIKKVISHPQALQQCKENIRKLGLEQIEYWDTTASLNRLNELNDDSICAIAPPNLSEKYNLFEIKKKFNDQENNITRFYLISLKNSKFNSSLYLNSNDKKSKIINVLDKFSGYVIIKNKLGSLQSYLNNFKENNINLTKIESRPYLGKDREVSNDNFSYIFYIEGVFNLGLDNTNLEGIDFFNYFGKFPLREVHLIKDIIASQSNESIEKDQVMIESQLDDFIDNTIHRIEYKTLKSRSNLGILIFGFGRFGQFISKKMVKYGFGVYATSRGDYTDEAREIGVNFIRFEDLQNFIEGSLKNNIDVIIFSTSINSFKDVYENFSSKFSEYIFGKLVVDVLSVKVYAKEIFDSDKYLSNDNFFLLTHPMFGPDSAKITWIGKKFIYWYDYNILQEQVNNKKFSKKILDNFLKFWEDQGCEMINLHPKDHDLLSANSQFLSHFIGRILEICNCDKTIIDTDLYLNLLKVKEYTLNDSWDLFDGLYKFNSESKDTIRKVKFSLFNLIEKLGDNSNVNKESSTGKMFSLIKKLKSEGNDILNLAIGEPDWFPSLEGFEKSVSGYSTSKGEERLVNNILEKIWRNELNKNSISKDNIMITSGAKFGLYLVFKHLTNPGSKWIVPKPYWVSYPDMINMLDGDVIFLETDVKNNWEPNIDSLWKTFKGSYDNHNINGIILSYPNNPTGLVYSEKIVHELLILAIKKEIYIIIDEVYLLIYSNLRSIYDIAISKDCSKFVIVVSSFSKFHAIPGWRVGYIIADSNIISDLCKIQSTISGCACKASQEIASNLLENNFNPNLDNLITNKRIIENKFLDIGWQVANSSKGIRSMYTFVYHDKKDEVDLLIKKLNEKNIFVMDGNSFGISNGIRILIPNNSDDLNYFLENI